jgi:hypothetical protein
MLLLNHKRSVIRHLTPEEVEVLRQPFTPDTALYDQQQSLLLQWREKHCWVQCNCRDALADADEKPIMALRRLPSGLIIFVQLPGSPTHDPVCPFFKLMKYKQYENGQRLHQAKKRTDFSFHRHAIERSDEDDENKDDEPSPGKSSQPGLPGLQRFLYNLAHEAGTHVFTHKTKLKEAAYLYRYQKAAETFTINRLFRLSDFLYQHINRRNAALFRLKASEPYWVKSARPHCIFLLPIDELVTEGNQTVLRRYRYPDIPQENKADPVSMTPTVEDLALPADCDLVTPGRVITNRRNPALAVLTFTDVSETDTPYYAPAKAVVVPVVSKDHLLIVESNYERVVAQCLRRYQRFLARRAKVQFFVTITKPLEDLRTPISEQRCRPDFILAINNRKVILEVMGSHDDEYLDRKRRTVPLMEELAPVYEFDARAAEADGELIPRAYAACREALDVLLADDPWYENTLWSEM